MVRQELCVFWEEDHAVGRGWWNVIPNTSQDEGVPGMTLLMKFTWATWLRSCLSGLSGDIYSFFNVFLLFGAFWGSTSSFLELGFQGLSSRLVWRSLPSHRVSPFSKEPWRLSRQSWVTKSWVPGEIIATGVLSGVLLKLLNWQITFEM